MLLAERGDHRIMLIGSVEWDTKLETMLDSAAARRMLAETLDGLPTHRRALIDEERTLSDVSERVHHMKIMIRIKLGSAEAGGPDELMAKVVLHPRKRPHIDEWCKILRWFRKGGRRVKE